MVADTLPRRFPHHKLLAKSFKFNAAGNEVSFQYRGPCEIDAQREYSERFISAIFDAYPYPTIKMLKHYEETVDAGK
jgi:hypothetical protein